MKKVAQIEEEVFRILVVMDKETGKILNYKKTDHPRRPKDKNNMAYLSSKPAWTTRIRSWWTHQKYKHHQIHSKRDIPADHQQDVTYGIINFTEQLENNKSNRSRFVAGRD